ncbi:MAG: amidohydrolase family protein [Chitinophagaceae bacterium]
MSYLKFAADHVFTGHDWLGADHVLITDKEGVILELLPKAEAGEGVQELRGILCPGFVNAHVHLELSYLKGKIPRRSGMIDFLLAVMGSRQQEEAVILKAIADADAAMYANGIAVAGDICNTPHTLHQKKVSSVCYHNFIEVTGVRSALATTRLVDALSLQQQFVRYWPTQTTVVPHALYSVAPQLLQEIIQLPDNQLLTLHNQESVDEQNFLSGQPGSFQRLYEALQLDLHELPPAAAQHWKTWLPALQEQQTLLLVHNVTTTARDLTDLHNLGIRSQVYFCLCPKANLYIGNGLPDVPLLRSSGLPLVIGTDSLASNDELNILAELRTLHQYFPEIPQPELLQWATLNGARALRQEEQYGSFDRQKKPGVLLLSPDWKQVRRIL